MHTSDGGASWRQQTSGIGWDLYSVTFTDASTGWAVGDWWILRTVDGGLTWERLQLDPPVRLASVSFADARNGWAAGAQGVLLRTTDGGSTWKAQDTGLGADTDLRAVTAANTYTAWAITPNLILHCGDSGRPTGSVDTTDTTAPITTAAGILDGWSRTALAIDLESHDGDGVAYTEWRLDSGGAGWTVGNHVVVDRQGRTILSYRSVDNRGNIEATRTAVIDIDGLPPATAASSALRVRRLATATFKGRLTDPAAPTCAVRLQIRRAGKIVRTVDLGAKAPGTIAVRWRCRLARGKYTYRFLATDLAGNPQSTATSKTLTIR